MSAKFRILPRNITHSWEQSPMFVGMQDAFAPAIDNGSIKLIRAEIKEFRGHEILLSNGNSLTDVNDVFFCTGYKVWKEITIVL